MLRLEVMCRFVDHRRTLWLICHRHVKRGHSLEANHAGGGSSWEVLYRQDRTLFTLECLHTEVLRMMQQWCDGMLLLISWFPDTCAPIWRWKLCVVWSITDHRGTLDDWFAIAKELITPRQPRQKMMIGSSSVIENFCMSADSLQLSLYTLRYDEQCSIAGSMMWWPSASYAEDKKRSDGHALDLMALF